MVWGTPANFNGFHVLAALLHGALVVGVSQTLRRWTEGATYIRQNDHHVGHWPTFLVSFYCLLLCLFHRVMCTFLMLLIKYCMWLPIWRIKLYIKDNLL